VIVGCNKFSGAVGCLNTRSYEVSVLFESIVIKLVSCPVGCFMTVVHGSHDLNK